VASKAEVVEQLRAVVGRAEAVADRVQESDLRRPVYSQGWNVKETFAHLATMGGSPAFFINMAQAGQGPPGDFDIDAFNQQQVDTRKDRSLRELVDEFRQGHEAGVKLIESSSDELLAKEVSNFRGGTSPVLEVVRMSGAEHENGHLDDIENALKGGWPS
jgi:hypothetical protein